jgi:hypothetical protein
VIKAEKDPEKRIELQNEIEDILDILKIADPEQGMAAEYLQKLPPSAFDTPVAKPKQAPTISAEKKDFVYEGKGLSRALVVRTTSLISRAAAEHLISSTSELVRNSFEKLISTTTD